MKNNLIKIQIALLLIFTNFVAIAQPGDTNDTNDLENIDAPAPINDYLLILGILGMILVYFKFKNLILNKNI